jgi:hypothetical protein
MLVLGRPGEREVCELGSLARRRAWLRSFVAQGNIFDPGVFIRRVRGLHLSSPVRMLNEPL